MDREIFNVLSIIEEQMQLKKKFTARATFLEGFLKGGACTLAAIEAICSYVSNTGKFMRILSVFCINTVKYCHKIILHIQESLAQIMKLLSQFWQKKERPAK